MRRGTGQNKWGNVNEGEDKSDEKRERERVREKGKRDGDPMADNVPDWLSDIETLSAKKTTPCSSSKIGKRMLVVTKATS